MKPYLLTVGSFSLLAVLHQSLKRIFICIEKAHEHLRETEPRAVGVKLVRERSD